MIKEYINENFIAGWTIDEKICDDLIQLYKDNVVITNKVLNVVR